MPARYETKLLGEWFLFSCEEDVEMGKKVAKRVKRDDDDFPYDLHNPTSPMEDLCDELRRRRIPYS